MTSKEYTQEVQKCYQEHPDRRTDETELSLWSVCLSTANDVLKLQQNNFTRDSAVGVLLPLIFFGGGFLYKYLFPLKGKN